jgi:preprotein translocase subunit SecD
VAPPTGHIRPGRYLWAFAVIVVLLYALVFGTGDHKLAPRLGIDLKGGTTVTLTARTLNGQPPSDQALSEAQSDIETRVNGLGVSGAEVVRNGNNIVITVPGNQGEEAKSLGQTAKLFFRPVIQSAAATSSATPSTKPKPATTPTPTTKATGTATPATPTVAATTTSAHALPALPLPGSASVGNSPEEHAVHQATVPPTPIPPATATPAAPPAAAGDVVIGGLDITKLGAGTDPNKNGECWGYQPSTGIPALTSKQQGALIQICKAVRQQTSQQAQQAALSFLRCGGNTPDPLRGNDDPNLPLVTCDQQGLGKYVLDKSFLDGKEISDASSGSDQNGTGFVVNLTFKSTGAGIWADYTKNHVGKQAAFVLDTQVVSAPNIKEAILGGNTQISGNFDQNQADQLANVLKYGSLPLAFEPSDAKTISASLGLASLKAGLMAGGLGLALVVIYCLFYYRALGVLTVLSLGLSGAVTYPILVLLGRWIGYSLDLAGVAGFIIAIGITADSFVVFFERLKDEVREGRTFRSAVPRAWIRARRTILASDAVSFLAAVVLYIFAVSDVQGFAFTLGLSTVLDLVIVFLVTHPLVILASRSKTLSKPNVSGLGAVQRAGMAMRATRPVTPGAVKEA